MRESSLSNALPAVAFEPDMSARTRQPARALARAAALASLLWASHSAHAVDSLGNLIDVIAQADRQVSYVGTYIYKHSGRDAELVKIARTVNESEFVEHLIALNGAQSQIVRTSEGIWCYFPDRNEGFFKAGGNPRYPAFSIDASSIDDIRKHYRVRMYQPERMMDRDVSRISFMPRDRYRYAHDLWVDSSTGLLVRSDLKAADDVVLDSFMFVDLKINPPQADAAMQEPDRSSIVALADMGANASWTFDTTSKFSRPIGPDESQWYVEVPNGFKLRNHTIAENVGSVEVHELKVYSDNLSRVSVLFRKEMENRSEYLDGLSQLGAINAYSRIIDDYNVLIVGEVPSSVVRAIGNSIKRIR